jgi:hypothetical protein
MKKYHVPILLLCLFAFPLISLGQPDRWQQKVKYKMDVTMDVQTNKMKGRQSIEYWNNSPDTLKVLFYHLYWNAFQPGSMMDARSRELGTRMVNGRPDWDGRVRDRISKLNETEIGYQQVSNLKVNGFPQKTELYETVLKVILAKPILPRTKALLELDFEAQVPVQIRRSGRDNAEGVRYSMAQWYPKLSEYDYEGWHPTPYVAREFYGVWGDFDVNITIDKRYVIGGTGNLLNPDEIGHGYESGTAPVKKTTSANLTWKFSAPNVHDFVWAADPEYKHVSRKVRDGLVLHAFYKISKAALQKEYERQGERARQRQTADQFIESYKAEWDTVLNLAARALPYIEKTFGAYPYKQYSFIQGGDGGMEYPMATLLKGAGKGVVLHEWMHSWYQMMLGTNESLYSWMDEGFTSYAESRVDWWLEGMESKTPHLGAYMGYSFLAKSEFNEPLTTHADQFRTNMAYSINAYSKGHVFMEQLGYIIGAETRDQVLLEYYRRWRFKHPNPSDFIRVAEDVSGIQLDWYKTFFVNTDKKIDYGIDSLWEEQGKLKVRLKSIGDMPMPVDVELQFKDGSREMAYIPQYLMFGAKKQEDTSIPRKVYEPWKWTHREYVFEVMNRKLTDLKTVEIDPSMRMADLERKNNKLELKW